MGTLRIAFLSGAILELAATLGIALVAVVVGVRLAEGSIGFEPALTVLVLAPELYLPLRNLAAQWHASADGAAVAERLLDLSDAPAVAVESVQPPIATLDADHVRARLVPVPDARARRAPRRRARDRAGRDGCARRAERSREVARCCRSSCASPSRRPGRIRVGDDDLASLDPKAWRRLTAYVPQQPTLFRGTVADNIRLGAPDAAGRAGSRGRGTRSCRRLRPRASRRVRDGGRRRRPRRSRRESGDASLSRAHSCETHRWCCSTSRRPTSIRRAPRSSPTRSTRCAREGRSCSSRTDPSSRSAPTGSSASARWQRPSRDDDSPPAPARRHAARPDGARRRARRARRRFRDRADDRRRATSSHAPPSIRRSSR